MEAQEFVLAIIAMAIGGAVLITAIVKGTDLIKSWLNRDSVHDEESFNRLAKAFISYKKESERRLQNIEAIITDDEPGALSEHRQPVNKSESHQAIEMHANDDEQHEADSSNLRNMLNQKRTR